MIKLLGEFMTRNIIFRVEEIDLENKFIAMQVQWSVGPWKSNWCDFVVSVKPGGGIWFRDRKIYDIPYSSRPLENMHWLCKLSRIN